MPKTENISQAIARLPALSPAEHMRVLRGSAFKGLRPLVADNVKLVTI